MTITDSFRPPKVDVGRNLFRKDRRWFLFLGLGLASYIYTLDSSTTPLYLAFATSSLGNHSLVSSVQVVQSIILGVGNPIVAKIADATSRGVAYITILILYVIGYVVIASARNVQTIVGGTALYALGNTGLQLLIQIMSADITTLEWRGLVSSLVSMPFIINLFIGANIAASVISHSSWRLGMFAIILPATLSPFIAVLLWTERNASGHKELAPLSMTERPSGRRGAVNLATRMDLVGLILLCTALSLVLVPLTISQTVRDGWKNVSIIAMLIIGLMLLVVFGVWEIKFARYPVVDARFLRNRSIVCAALIGFFDYMSFYLTYTYLYSYVLVVKDWSLVDVNYFVLSQAVALTASGILAGVLLKILHRYKAVLMVGLLIRLLGVGLMIHSRGANSSTMELLCAQIIQGVGGGFASITSLVGAQASVPSADIALVTALELLVPEVGGAVGTAIAGAIWVNTLPKNLARYLPNASREVRDALYASVITVHARPRGDPVREDVILACGETTKMTLIAATAVAVLPVVLSLFMPDWVLENDQKAVARTDTRSELKYRLNDGEEQKATATGS